MSVDYRGHMRTGYLSKVTNTIDSGKFNVSTAWTRGEWETAILKQGFFGALRPLARITSHNETQAKWVHDRVEEIVEAQDQADWKYHISKTVSSDESFFRALKKACGED